MQAYAPTRLSGREAALRIKKLGAILKSWWLKDFFFAEKP
jgi:hypothetical protein